MYDPPEIRPVRRNLRVYVMTLVPNASVPGSAVQACSTKSYPCEYLCTHFELFSKITCKSMMQSTKLDYLTNNSCYFNNLAVPKRHLIQRVISMVFPFSQR